MNPYLIAIPGLLFFEYALETVADWLDLRNFSETLPPEFLGTYPEDRYRQSQRYHRDWMRFGMIQRTTILVLTLAFLFEGGFNWVDQLGRSFSGNPIVLGLFFIGALGLLRLVVQTPFSLWGTFVIEEQYGFNKTTLRVFIGDLVKGVLLSILIGGPVFAGFLYFFENVGGTGWLYAWLLVTFVQLALVFLAPAYIMPLFNRFEPIAEGDLKNAIDRYMRDQNFRLEGIYQMDGSKRSTKANAFFAGFGRFRKLVLFDTLITKHSVSELVAVLAHEVGHFKRHHIIKSMAYSILTTALLFASFSLFLGNPQLAAAFRMEHVSVYSSLVFIGFLYSPVMRLLSIFGQTLSRRHEYEADAFAARTYGDPEALIRALKKLSADNLSQLTPHPLKVILNYSHPPILRRIEALRRVKP